jgi:uncharacterized protein YlxW (UPF0749 family)
MTVIIITFGIILMYFLYYITENTKWNFLPVIVIIIFFVTIFSNNDEKKNVEKNYNSHKNEKVTIKKNSSKRQLKPRVNSQNNYLNSYQKSNYSTPRTYYRGPRGGCYYINSKGNKTYVDRTVCN